MCMVRNVAVLILIVCIMGCAGIEPPMPDDVLNHPLGTEPLRVGMTKAEVVAVWGRPDTVNKTGTSKGVGGTSREEWIYYPRYSGIPIDGGYLSRAKYLYFDGNHLVRYGN